MSVFFFPLSRRVLGRLPGGARALFLVALAGLSFLSVHTPASADADQQPMRFLNARLAMTGCEPVCPEWIAADGKIVADSAVKFRKFLKNLGKKRLPILINSGGGDVDAALAIGKLIRDYELDVAVARTRFQDCPTDVHCLPKGREIYPAMPDLFAICASACPFVLASGVQRFANSPAMVGVHQITTVYTGQRLTYKTEYRIVKGKKKVISRKVVKRSKLANTVSTELTKTVRKQLLGYFKRMGVGGPELIDAMLVAPPDDINMLDVDQLLKLRLVTGQGSAANLVGSSVCPAGAEARNCIRVGGFPATPPTLVLRSIP